ncbi:MAG: orotate phosphoribosyltransferase [Acidobacteria bacterium]|nr:orotate phosphoribosyltransferase [Acidobacteriota bacterium]
MDRQELLDLFRRSGALLEGHFRLSSGLHSSGYLQCALVLQHPDAAARIGAALGEKLRVYRPTAILSPALGGIIIGHEIARALGARAIFAERQDGALMLRRGFILAEAERIVVIEDVLTTGGSTRETIQIARASGALVVAVGAIVDRSAERAALDLPFHSLLEITFPQYEPHACPLCEQGLAIEKPGSRPSQTV